MYSVAARMHQIGLLVLSSPVRRLQKQLPAIVSKAGTLVQDTLYVHLTQTPEVYQPLPGGQALILPSKHVQDFINRFYGYAATYANTLDVRFLLQNITDKRNSSIQKLHKCYDVVILEGTQQDQLKCYVKEVFPSEAQVSYEVFNIDTETPACDDDVPLKTYDNVVLGGTFDRIHTGHKIFLSQACLLCNNRMTIGVTDGPMNSKKSLGELIAPVSERIGTLRELLEDIKPSVNYNIVPITDPFGPSIVEPDLQCIVVSEETRKGGQAVNNRRLDKGLSELDISVVDLVEDTQRAQEEEVKISSSSSRKRLLGTLLKAAKKLRAYKRPYIIGLTGGIASGKSSVCKRLQGLGACIIDCDKLGHQSYAKGTDVYHKVMEQFGDAILTIDGEIDRKALGAKVFSDKSQLEKLNRIVWPGIAKLAEKEITDYEKKGAEIVVLDAAVLLEAGWQQMTNEIWVTFVPKNEAVTRIMDRNKLNEEEALKRISSQMSNEERIAQANVLLSTLWHPDVTQKQVEKAWELLKARLHEQQHSLS